MDPVSMGHWVAEEAEAEGGRAFGPTRSAGVHGLLQQGSGQHARRNKPLAFNRLNTGYREVRMSIQRVSHESQNHWERQAGFPKCSEPVM